VVAEPTHLGTGRQIARAGPGVRSVAVALVTQGTRRCSARRYMPRAIAVLKVGERRKVSSPSRVTMAGEETPRNGWPPYHPAWQPGQAGMPPEAARTEGPPRTRPRRWDGSIARSAPSTTVHEATKRSPCHRLDPTEPADQKPPPGRHDPCTCREQRYDVRGPRDPVMCSVTAMRPAQNRAYRILHSQSCCSAGLLALWRRADPSHPIPMRMWSATTATDGDSPAFALVRACIEPPAGIEPATPSLP
jgi:hypothetical protein